MGGAIYPIIEFIEGTEHWGLAHNEAVSQDLDRLGEFLESATSLNAVNEEDFIKLCAPLFLSQKLRIMQITDALSPGYATKMIKKAEEKSLEDNNCAIFLKRNILFERIRIISRIFTPERIQMVQILYET